MVLTNQKSRDKETTMASLRIGHTFITHAYLINEPLFSSVQNATETTFQLIIYFAIPLLLKNKSTLVNSPD